MVGSSLTIVTSGTIIGELPGDNSFASRANAITFTGGINTLILEAGYSITGNVVAFSSADTLAIGGSANAAFNGSQIGPAAQYQGFGALLKTGTSTWTLTGTPGVSTPWTVTGGLLNFNAASNFDGGTITLNGGGLQWATGTSTDISGRLAPIGSNGGTFDTNGNNVTFASALTGAGGITKQGSGTLILTSYNVYTGATTIAGGTLALSGDFGSIANSSGVNLTAAGATFDVSAANVPEIQGLTGVTGSIVNLTSNSSDQTGFLLINQTGTTTFAGSFTGGNASYLGFQGTGTQILSGVSTETGFIDVQSGTLAMGVGGSIASNLSMVVESGARFDISIGGDQTVQNLFGLSGSSITLGANTLTIVDSANQQNSIAGVISGTGGLTLQGSGAMILSGANTYTGETTVSDGALAVTGSLAGGVEVVNGASLFGRGTIGGSLTNAGTVVPNSALNASRVIGTLTVGGNYTQSGSGTLTIAVSPNAASKLAVGGAANLAGTLALAFEPGVYTVGSSYTILSAASLNGQFSTITGNNPAGIAPTLVYETDPAVILRLSPAVVAPTNDTIYSAATSIAVINAQQINGIILDRIGARQAGIADGQIAALAPGDMTGGAPGLQLAQASGGNGAALGEAAAALPGALSAQGAWFRGIGGFASVNGSSTAPGFTGSTGGFLAGYDRPVAPGIYLGVAGGYLHSSIDEHSTSNGSDESARFNVYGGMLAGPSLFSATAGYAHDWLGTNRGLAGIGTAAENHGSNEATAAGQWSLPLPIAGYGGGMATLTPKAGIEYLYLSQDAFAETGGAGFDLANSGHGTNSLQPYIGAAVSQKFVTEGGTEIAPELRLGYAHDMFDSRLLTVTTVSGASFPVEGVKPSRDQLSAGLGVVMQAATNVSAYADYDPPLSTPATPPNRPSRLGCVSGSDRRWDGCYRRVSP